MAPIYRLKSGKTYQLDNDLRSYPSRAGNPVYTTQQADYLTEYAAEILAETQQTIEQAETSLIGRANARTNDYLAEAHEMTDKAAELIATARNTPQPTKRYNIAARAQNSLLAAEREVEKANKAATHLAPEKRTEKHLTFQPEF